MAANQKHGHIKSSAQRILGCSDQKAAHNAAHNAAHFRVFRSKAAHNAAHFRVFISKAAHNAAHFRVFR